VNARRMDEDTTAAAAVVLYLYQVLAIISGLPA
jgi:hypothetical protein